MSKKSTRDRARDRTVDRQHDALIRRSRQGERDFIPIPSDELLRPPITTGSISGRAIRKMVEVEDRRRLQPDGKRPFPKDRAGRPTRIVAPLIGDRLKSRLKPVKIRRDTYGQEFLPWSVAFKDPKQVLVCIRRRIRREVLHAFRLTGKGSGAKRHRLNEFSGIQC